MIKDIVVCKECKYWNITDEKQGEVLRGFCFQYGGRTHEDDYCFRAEKRVKDEN